MSGSLPAAEDAVQEALVRAWQRSGRGEDIHSLDAWIATVALNLSRSGIRRRIAERRAHARAAARHLPAEDPDSVDVRRALAALPRRQRQVAVLRYVLELDTAETAAVLRIAEGSVKSTLAKARAHLAESLRIQDVEVNDHAEP